MGVTAVAQHVPGERNTISDHLSRGRGDAAMRESKALFGKARIIPSPREMNTWAESAIRAARSKRRRYKAAGVDQHA